MLSSNLQKSWQERTTSFYEGKEAVEAAKTRAIEGMEKWQIRLAETLGVKVEDLVRTTGSELEFTLVSTDRESFVKRAQELIDTTGLRSKSGEIDYDKEPKYFQSATPSLPEDWQRSLEHLQKPSNLCQTLNSRPYPLIMDTESFTLEPTGYVNAIKRDLKRDETYLSAEVVSKPLNSLVAGKWLQNIGQYFLNIVESKKRKDIYPVFHPKPDDTMANSLHMHLGLQVKLTAFLQPRNAENSLFPTEKEKKNLLKRNVSFYGETCAETTEEKALCDAIAEACDSQKLEDILAKKQNIRLIDKITVNMFSRRELEGPETAKPSEISQFGFHFIQTLERFNRDCMLVLAPTESSYLRFFPTSVGAPTINAAFPEKSLTIMGSCMPRGDERRTHGSHNPEGKPDTGPLRVENRIAASNALGHPNHAYPNQQVMPWEIMEGMEGVFAEAGRKYKEHLVTKAEEISEEEIFRIAKGYEKNFKEEKLIEDCVPKENLLPHNRDEAVARFEADNSLARTIFGGDERLQDMVERRNQLNQIEELDNRLGIDNPGPHVTRTVLENKMPLDPNPVTKGIGPSPRSANR